ncbi:hypothetical protein FB45DRAFT_358285 [Roridomyces roridus]|uniref:Actin-like ATPase domain-containing protein n=1 Tax=Roridomyces roridus TaxID=1738132 RepID=A0AAD7C7W4_9AGAR|nr:hypothetical protein FB45DRAFT_358285 [Roridomyces roridus]
MATDNRRAPYAGTSRKLVISIDVGTTFTATSFCLLQPGNVPKFEEILRWPKQATPDAKVPSVLYYDRNGVAKAFGAETEDEDTIIEAEENGWKKTEWWKLAMRSGHLPLIRDLTLPPLSPGVTVDQIFADHLRYIKDQVKAYITSTYGSGENIWNTLFPTMYVILTTPNGWEGSQQNRMRQAAIKAGLVDENGGRRVKFVTEAEAAVLYAADSGSVGDWLVDGAQLILCDCGGGTVDITGYKIDSVKPTLKLEEASASRCYLAGAVFVTTAAKEFIKNRLRGTEWDDEERMQRIVYHFDRNAKKKFSEEDTVCYVNLEGSHKTVPELGILRGRLKLTAEEMRSFFDTPLQQIIDGLEIAFENGGRAADKVILVGGLASSPYVYSKLVSWGKEFGISVSRPDGPTVKAVANGALAWHLDGSVGARIAKFFYGINIRVPYKAESADHRERQHLTITGLDGTPYLHMVWSGIVKKNDKVDSTREFRSSFILEMSTPPAFMQFPGKQQLVPGFDVLCKVQGNLQRCYQAIHKSRMTPSGKRIKDVAFEVCLGLGETEITARMCWKENGEDVYGPATIAYD